MLSQALFLEDSLDRWTNWFIGSMGTANPTTWPTLAVLQVADQPLNVLFSRLVLLHKRHPTNPLVACEWGKAFPCRACGRVFYESIPNICWHRMDDAFGDGDFRHSIH